MKKHTLKSVPSGIRPIDTNKADIRVHLSKIKLVDIPSGGLLGEDKSRGGLQLVRAHICGSDNSGYVNSSSSDTSKGGVIADSNGGVIEYDDLDLHFDLHQTDVFCHLRMDVLWEPNGRGMGVQDAGYGATDLFTDDGKSVIESATVQEQNMVIDICYIDYLSSLMAWDSPLKSVGKLEFTISVTGDTDALLSGGGEEKIKKAHRQAQGEKAQLRRVQALALKSFRFLYGQGAKGLAIYPSLYRQTVPSTHLVPPCFHLAMHMDPRSCRIGLAVLVNLMLLGCKQCSISPEEFMRMCYTDPARAVHGPYKVGLMNFANSVSYRGDVEAILGRDGKLVATERFSNTWAAMASMKHTGNTNALLCGDCEDDANAMVKLHVGIQTCSIDTHAKEHTRLFPSSSRYIDDVVMFARAVQRIAQFYVGLPVTCSCNSASANDVSTGNEDTYCTHTTMFLVPNSILSAWVGLNDFVRHIGVDEPAQLPMVLVEGTALVSQINDMYDSKMKQNEMYRLAETLSTQLKLKDGTETTTFLLADTSNFYVHITQVTIPYMGFYAKWNGVYGIPFEVFAYRPHEVELEPMYPTFTETERDAMRRLCVTECPVFSLDDDEPGQCGRNLNRCIIWHRCANLNPPKAVWTGGVIRGNTSDQQAGDLSGSAFDTEGCAMSVERVPICAGMEIHVYGNTSILPPHQSAEQMAMNHSPMASSGGPVDAMCDEFIDRPRQKCRKSKLY